MRAHAVDHHVRFAPEPDVGDPHHLDAREQVVLAFPVGLEGAPRALGGEDVQFDAEPLALPITVELVRTDVEVVAG
jgi:hypothetical protein